MKCNDCGYLDRNNIHDKCPECKSDNWVKIIEETPRSIAKRIVRDWAAEDVGDYKLIELIAKAIKDERK